MSASTAPSYRQLRDLPGVGPASEGDLNRLHVFTLEDFTQRDPEALFASLELLDGPTDRCMLYLFRCAHYAATATSPDAELLQWWRWKD